MWLSTRKYSIPLSFVTMWAVMIGSPTDTIADDGATQFLQSYVATAKEAYTGLYSQYPPPKSETQIARNSITTLRNDWLTPSLPTPDMWFYKWHSAMNFTLSKPQGSDDSVRIVVKADPQSSEHSIPHPTT